MLILPVTFVERGTIGISRAGSIPNGGGGVKGSSDRMSWNMSGCYRLACGTGSRMAWITLFYITGSHMGCK